MAAEKFLFPTVNKLALCFLMALGPVPAAAGEVEQRSASSSTATAALAALIDGFDGVTGRFRQSILDSANKNLEESSGSVALQRPKFRWQVETPFAQLIVVNGAVMQIYDPDLAQVTVHELDAEMGPTPLTMLLGDTASLTSEFAVSSVVEGGEQRFLLYPKSPTSLILQAELTFRGGLLQGLLMWDSAGHRTRIQFSQIQLAQRIEAELFNLVVPEGTDVIRG